MKYLAASLLFVTLVFVSLVDESLAGDYPQLPEGYKETVMPTPTATPTPTPTLVPPGPGPTLDPSTPTPTPTPTLRNPECPFYVATRITYSFDNNKYNSDLSPNPYTLLPDGKALSCLVNIIDDVVSSCSDEYGDPNDNFHWKYDDCLVRHGIFDALTNYLNSDRTFDFTAQEISDGVTEKRMLYFDENCMPVRLKDVDLDQVCSAIDLEFVISPISLLWGDTTELPTEVSITTFPLDPRTPGNSYIWRASAKLPLLVYDPEHTGEITSGDQLFGNWTFGGKKSESGASSPWKNGYEALRTLDSDESGAVDGDELLPLGLWFDKNQDGISQPGEVQPLAAVGVTKLFFEISREDAKSGDLWAEKGYERVHNGEVTTAASVDWYVEGSQDSMTLLSKIEARGEVCNSPAGHAQNAGTPSVASAAPIQQLKLGGVWKWSMVGGNAGGLMVFDPKDKEGGKGTILTELFLKEGAVPGIRSRLNTAQIEGIELSYYKDGSVNPNKFSFRAVTDKTRTENQVKLSGDGRSLSGSSKTDIMENGEVVQTITYRWSGTKL